MTVSSESQIYEPFQRILGEKKISPQRASVLLSLSREDQEHIYAALFHRCCFTKSELLQLIECLDDIRRRERTTLDRILSDPELDTILRNAETPKKKSEKVMRFFLNRRHPQTSCMEVVWKDGLDSLGRPAWLWIPLARALECSRLEDAVECPPQQRKEADVWIREKKEELKRLITRLRVDA